MEPLDLTKRPPRSPREQLLGLYFLPRTIDKLRALLPGGNPGQYFINGPILGISGFLLQRLGITEQQLSEAIAAAATENDIVIWLREHVDTSQYPKLNHIMQKITAEHTEDPAIFRGIYAETLATRPGLERVMDVIVADDERLFTS